MECLGKFPIVLNVLPRKKIEGPLRDFLKANLRPNPRPDQRQKTRGVAGTNIDSVKFNLLVRKVERMILLEFFHSFEE